MPYDPLRSHHRPEPAEDAPAPVDALLDADVATEVDLPGGVEVEVTDGGEVVVHTMDADVEITPTGDDVVVRTDDAVVEVRPEADEVLVSAGGETSSSTPPPGTMPIPKTCWARRSRPPAGHGVCGSWFLPSRRRSSPGSW